MATSHSLSPPFSRPSSSSTNHDSSTNIFIPSLSNPSSSTASLKSPTDCQFSSLEELLSATGIPTDSPPLSDTASLKRPLVADENDITAAPKRPRLSPPSLSSSSSTLSASSSSTFSAPLSSSTLSVSSSTLSASPSVANSGPSPVPAQGLIPSILAHSSSNHSKLPNILPASTTQSVLSSVSNSLSLPAVSLSSTLPSNSILPQLSTTVNASMALLAQLFRQYQAIGDEAGMQKTRQQLLSLIAKTANKPAVSDQSTAVTLSVPISASSALTVTTTSTPALAPQLTNSTGVTSSSGAGLSNSLLSSTSSLLPLATSKPHSPSIVTQPPPPAQSSSAAPTNSFQNVFPLSAVAGSNKSLPSLHITPQTQTNIMRAVYSYRLKQIQDFISSLPPQQRPTTTQGLRDLLVKHNMAAKLQTIPQSLLVQLQQSSQTPSSTTSTTASMSTTSDVVSTSASTPAPSTVSSSVLQSTPAPQASVSSLPQPTPPQTVSLTGSSSTPSTSSASPLLPGVTVETLRTLCRLPNNSLSRIPMHRTLMGIVQYLRARGWAGNRVELPALLQQAQEAVNKGQLTTQQQQTLSTTTPSKQQQAGASNQLSAAVSSTSSSLFNNRPSTYAAASSSPLSQYMASVGMKIPRTDLTQSTPTGVRSYNNTYSRNNTMGTSSGLLNRTGTSQAATPSGLRPVTRYQLKVQQERVEHERLAALQKVLQSSEEARIAFRFQAHMEKLHQQLCAPDTHRGFSSNQDVVLRLVPYHVWAEPELPPGAVEKADAVYEGIASVLLSRAHGLMSRYNRCILRDEEFGGETEPSAILLERLFVEGERERKEEEERQRRAEEAATTGFVGTPVDSGNTSQTQLMSADPFLLDSDPFSDDPFLPHLWSPDFSVDLGTGIT